MRTTSQQLNPQYVSLIKKLDGKALVQDERRRVYVPWGSKASAHRPWDSNELPRKSADGNRKRWGRASGRSNLQVSSQTSTFGKDGDSDRGGCVSATIAAAAASSFAAASVADTGLASTVSLEAVAVATTASSSFAAGAAASSAPAAAASLIALAVASSLCLAPSLASTTASAARASVAVTASAEDPPPASSEPSPPPPPPPP
eukprot:CAMPEP_0196690124 /NCGR_PEP_ID=MMETSP1090-20130531/19730_1 /TAXON_ID=37098 /ORGANISM="Isochrysis sp, Strain CCMP1244" /LENGTH=202 /DNA_ID=CAMNT_0042029209 /DNA_START=361 /DNA_END=968 /DNA_ORIENTATION=+